MRFVAVEVPEQSVDVGGRIPEVEELGLDEAFVDSALELRPQRIEEAVEIENGDGLAMVAELLEGERFQHFLERAEAARQGHEGVAPLVHDRLAVPEPVGDHELREARVAHAEL